MPRYIKADDLAIKFRMLAEDPWSKDTGTTWSNAYEECADNVDEFPTADVVERKKGKWTEKQVIHAEEAKEVVEEWQSCRCSICGHYNTQPYMYYFSEPNYCSFCGASMKEEATDAQLD